MSLETKGGWALVLAAGATLVATAFVPILHFTAAHGDRGLDDPLLLPPSVIGLAVIVVGVAGVASGAVPRGAALALAALGMIGSLFLGLFLHLLVMDLGEHHGHSPDAHSVGWSSVGAATLLWWFLFALGFWPGTRLGRRVRVMGGICLVWLLMLVGQPLHPGYWAQVAASAMLVLAPPVA